MFKYLSGLVFIFWCQTQGYAFAQTDIKILPLTSLKSNNPNNSEIAGELEKRPVVVLNGHNNYHVAQQVFYIYNEQQKRLLPNNKERLDGYVVTPSMGAHKLNPRKLTWNKARQACIQEGGHLAIINSESEEKILLRMLQEGNINLAWLGVHDYFEEGDWVTVKGEALENTGYMRWTTKWPNVPDNFNGQNCAVLIKEGGMDDDNCHTTAAYFCEIPL
ncbi:hemolymph lipopolysaccharide-binding protein-like [Nylanderia fulva]|uniref:hemolymph lipopolysaccharide-binding protein-like n=1 Tax=Nylanderia fulva TaxID=613905 RepID=UPI0010FBB470|nr:hemolymph lipopolysaccharide-binding protein-like [Nylanderia fulva]